LTRIYSLVNQKGGVGKTTTTVNLGSYLAHHGQRVLVVDLDPQANATSCLGVDKRGVQSGTYESLLSLTIPSSSVLMNERLRMALLPSSQALAGAEVELVDELAREMRLKRALESLDGRYDYVLIDCPPSLGLLTSLTTSVERLARGSNMVSTTPRTRNSGKSAARTRWMVWVS